MSARLELFALAHDMDIYPRETPTDEALKAYARALRELAEKIDAPRLVEIELQNGGKGLIDPREVRCLWAITSQKKGGAPGEMEVTGTSIEWKGVLETRDEGYTRAKGTPEEVAARLGFRVAPQAESQG